MTSIYTAQHIGKDVFKEIIKMSNEIQYCDQIKYTIDYILKDIHKLPLLIDFIPTSTLTLFGHNYYTGINLINTVILMNKSLGINDTIKFIVDIYKIPNSPNSIQLLFRLLFDENLYIQSYTFDLEDKDDIIKLIKEWIKIRLFDFVYECRNIDGFHFKFFKKLLKRSYSSIPTLETVRPIPISLV